MEFLLTARVPPLGGGRVGGWKWSEVIGCPPHMCTYIHMHTCAHMCTHAHTRMTSYGIPQKSNGGGHLHEIIMFTTHAYACTCVHVCTCVYMCVGQPQSPPTPNHPLPMSTKPPIPQNGREPKTPKFNKSWTNQDNSILFEDSLSLNTSELI